MADINFTLEEAEAPNSAMPTAMVYTTGLTGENKVGLASTTMELDPNFGSINGVIFNDVIDINTVSIANNSRASGNVVIDLASASSFFVEQIGDAEITFSNLPGIGTGKIIDIFRVQHTNDEYSWGYNGSHNVYYEGSLRPTYSHTANSGDLLRILIFNSSTSVEFWHLQPISDYALGSSIRKLKRTPNTMRTHRVNLSAKKTQPIQPNDVSGIEEGMIITSSSDGSLYATGLKTDGDFTITNQCTLKGCTIQNLMYALGTTNSSSSMILPMDGTKILQLNQAVNIDTLAVSGTDPNYPTTLFVPRLKDGLDIARNINFDSQVFKWDSEPTLTQTPYARDLMVLSNNGITTFLNIFNNFGPV